jgi:cellulose synthase/poly-beta-1,6-N-acetylglucosamine synthase-like glycosyltransferase
VAAGADVVVRNEPDRKGKGYALAWGLRHLSVDPPDIVIVIDADCRLTASAIGQLAAVCAVTHRPVQAFSQVISSDESPINTRVAEFAWRVKNWVRPLGLKSLGLPCQLMGTGMAFPWSVISSVDVASGLIVEDLKIGLELALAGKPPLFCPSVAVTSIFPFTVEGVQGQRLRWEQGHIQLILTMVPRLILAAILRTNLKLLSMAFDLAIPPLGLLGMMVTAVSVVSGLAGLFGISSAAVYVSFVSLVGFIIAVSICWLKFGRDVLPPRSMFLIASYAFGKFPLYRRILSCKLGPEWIRADRRKR